MRNILFHKTLFTALLAALVLACCILPVQSLAQTNWEFSGSPYVWMASMDGDIEIGDRSADIDMGFTDILDVLDFSFLGHFEARKDRFGVFADLNYMKLSMDEEVVRTRGSLDVDMTVQSWVNELAGTYRLTTWPGRVEHTDSFLDIVGGGRFWDMSITLDETLSIGGLEVDRERNAHTDWIDPFVGARAQLALTEHLAVNLRGDVGGFGLGEASDFSWHAIGLLGWRFNDRVAAWGGYKALNIQREGNTDLDVTMHGPIVGLSLTF